MKLLDQFIPEFEKNECFYKENYFAHPEAHLDEAQSLRSIQASLPMIDPLCPTENRRPADVLSEQELPGYADVTIRRHLRYSPAYLHSHTFFEIIIVFQGNCRNIFSTETLSMKARDICIIPPGTIHALSAFEDNCVIYNLLVRSATFEQTFLNSIPQESILYSFFSNALFMSKNGSYLYVKKAGEEELYRIFEKILKEYHDKRSYFNNLINAYLSTFFILLLRKHEKDFILPNPSGKKEDRNMIFILKYIDQHVESITLKELACFFNYSERQLTRILKDYTGQTFTQLIQNTKMSKACALLKHPDIPISDIIECSGYTNSSHFYDVFKKTYHMTPAEYRKQYEQEINMF